MSDYCATVESICKRIHKSVNVVYMIKNVNNTALKLTIVYNHMMFVKKVQLYIDLVMINVRVQL